MGIGYACPRSPRIPRIPGMLSPNSKSPPEFPRWGEGAGRQPRLAEIGQNRRADPIHERVGQVRNVVPERDSQRQWER